MTDNGDGTYTKVFTNVQIADSLQIEVVENTADGGQKSPVITAETTI